MKKALIVMTSFVIIPVVGMCQQWQGVITLDSRAGYSTNTILNPFFGEWDRDVSSAYGFLAPLGQFYWGGERYSADMAAGGIFEPFFDDRNALAGGFGLLNFRRRVGSSWSAGIETGGNYFTSTFDRSMAWVQPVITWSPSLFSQFRFKAGSTFRNYSNIPEESNSNDRFDLFGIEFETWPDFKWQIRTGVYGNLDQPDHNLSFLINSEHLLTEFFQLSLRLTADRYSYQLIQEGGNGGPGFPPVGGGAGVGSEEFDETDRLLRAGLSAQYRLNSSFSLTLNLDHLSLHSSASEQTLTDYQISAGVRYTFQPRLGGRGKAVPSWEQNDAQTINLRINYSGEGQLYILGDFNDWENPGIPLIRQSSGRFVARLSLPAGAYEYKILLIETSGKRWIEFSDDIYTVDDGFGGRNGLVFIK